MTQVGKSISEPQQSYAPTEHSAFAQVAMKDKAVTRADLLNARFYYEYQKIRATNIKLVGESQTLKASIYNLQVLHGTFQRVLHHFCHWFRVA
jgi:hypothetical protein